VLACTDVPTSFDSHTCKGAAVRNEDEMAEDVCEPVGRPSKGDLAQLPPINRLLSPLPPAQFGRDDSELHRK
jgi:hypothetical protein